MSLQLEKMERYLALVVLLLLVVIVFIMAALLKWLQKAATSVPPSRPSEDEDTHNG